MNPYHATNENLHPFLTSFALSHYVFQLNMVLVLALPLHVRLVAVLGCCSP
jgi:hypothetical protein